MLERRVSGVARGRSSLAVEWFGGGVLSKYVQFHNAATFDYACMVDGTDSAVTREGIGPPVVSCESSRCHTRNRLDARGDWGPCGGGRGATFGSLSRSK